MIKKDGLKTYSDFQEDDYVESVKEALAELSPDELEFVLQYLQNDPEAVQVASVLAATEYEKECVTIRQWLDDPYYMGDITRDLYPLWKEDLIELFESKQYQTVFLTGSFGSGKTTVASLAILRMIYEASCLREPARSYGVATGSPLHFVNLAPNAETARKTFFETAIIRLRQSPYFREEFWPINLNSERYSPDELRFPKNILVKSGSSSDNSTLGLTVLGGFIDELNFFQRDSAERRKRENTIRYGEGSKAGRLFDNLQRRIKSRFLRNGRLPGMLIGGSSKDSQESLSERLIADALDKQDKRTFIRDRSILELKREQYSKTEFTVLVGNQYQRSRILDPGEVIEVGENEEAPQTIQVPEDFRPDFEADCDRALRDIAGVSTITVSGFFRYPEKIYACIDASREHPFKCHLTQWAGDWDSRSNYRVEWDKLVSTGEDGISRPILYPHVPRFIHLDPATTGDAFGFAVGCVPFFQEVRKFGASDPKLTEYQPYFHIDFVLRIQGSKLREVDFANVRRLIYEFSAKGFFIKRVTTDTFQSTEMIQALKKKGYDAEVLSVDTSKDHYYTFRNAINEGRVSMYKHPKLIEEMTKLEDGTEKVDHPPNGCFVGETRIPLLDGRIVPISELDGKEVWVFSTAEDGSPRPGRARGRLTKYVTEVVDLILDNGATIRCTPEHPFRLKSGEYCKAEDLRVGLDRLMILNRTYNVNGGYRRITDHTGQRYLEHHMAVGFDRRQPGMHDMVVHHLNGCKIDNRPENLEIVQQGAHAREHTTLRWSEDGHYASAVIRGSRKYNARPEVRANAAARWRKTILNMPKEELQARARNRKNFRSDIDLERLKAASEADSASEASKYLSCGRNVVVRVLKDHGFASWQEFKDGLNHKVVSIERVTLPVPLPVYDLEVDDWSNFLLHAGVIVHNSKDLADGVCGVISSASEHAGNDKPNLPMKGLIEREDQQDEMMASLRGNPNQGPATVVQVQEGGDIKVYKKQPKTAGPTYGKKKSETFVPIILG